MRIILFGFKGCGKTYFGRRLASVLNLPFIDTDFLIEDACGKTAREFALHFGEKVFRKIEKSVIHSLHTISTAIIAVGGGAILDPENVKEMQRLGLLVYLKVDKETIKQRIFSGPFPSYLDYHNKEKSFEFMYDERLPLYESIPAACINISEKTDKEVIAIILNHLQAYGK